MKPEEAILNLHEIKTDTVYCVTSEEKEAIDMAIEALKGRPHGECNQCRYYEGVHCVQGHAPCSFWKIGGVMWNDYCSRFEEEGETE